jgi:alkylated DNA repair dioxygenase AlkB
MTRQKLDLPGGDVCVYPSPPLKAQADELFQELHQNIPWEQRSVTIVGIERQQPRLISWHGDHAYTYSGLRLEPKPWTDCLLALREQMTDLTGCFYNGVLLNLYQDGRSSIGMHADDEKEFGDTPTIASVSLGAQREMVFKIKDNSLPPVKIILTHGSVLVMAGRTQQVWKHGVMKTSEEIGPRINLTFRNILHPR